MKRLNYLLIIGLSWFFLSTGSLFACQYSIELYDSYGDGWNGGTVSVLVNGNTVLSNLTIADGYGPAVFTFNVAHGDQISTVYSPGSYSSENEYYIYNSAGILVFSDGAMDVTPTGGIVGLAVCPDHDLAVVDWIAPSITCAMGLDTLRILVVNFGVFAETNFTLSYSIDNGSTFHTDTINSTLNPGDSLEHAFSLPADFSALGSYPCLALVHLNSDQVPANDTITKDIYHSPIFTSFPYLEDFESGSGHWHSSGIYNSWALGLPSAMNFTTAYSGTNAWATNLTGSHNTMERSWVESPCFDFSGLVNPYVSLYFDCDAEYESDGAALQYTTDGVNWQHIGNAGDPNNWYNDWWNNSLLYFGNREGWSGYWGQWNQAIHALPFLAGAPFVKFRLVFASDDYDSGSEGFVFDDFSIFQPPFMAFNTLNATQNNTNGIGQGAVSAEILGITINATGSTSPIQSGTFFFNATGMKAISDIDSARLYYTGQNPNFATFWQTGNAVAPSGPFSIASTIELAEGNNYFWLTYDVGVNAQPGNTLDAILDSVVVDDTARIPINGNPAGNRLILEAMAGSYIIDSAGSGYYLSFSEAVQDMILRGVKDSVTFLVKPGHYYEQIIIPAITGASANRPIRFTSYTGDSSSVVLHYQISSSDSNYVVRLDGADHFTFERMTLQTDEVNIGLKASNSVGGRVINLMNGASHNAFMHLVIRGFEPFTSSTAYAVVYSQGYENSFNTFTHNAILNGSTGIYLEGSYYSHDQQNRVENNRIEGFYYSGIYAYNQGGAKFNHNTLIANALAAGIYAIMMNEFSGSNQVVSNTIIAAVSSYAYGIYAYYLQGIVKTPSIIANNAISLGTSGGSSVRGLYLVGSNQVLIAHNSINILSTSTTSYNIYSSNNPNIGILNNILRQDGGGRLLYFTGTNRPVVCDHNVLYSTGPLFAFDGLAYNDLSTWKTSGYDSSSISIEPGFFSETDLRLLNADIDGIGTPLTQIPVDITGAVRDTLHPDPGAYEFDPPAQEVALLRLMNPESGCGLGQESITIEMLNRGTQAISGGLTAYYSINGGSSVSASVTGTYLPGATFTFTFPTPFDFTAPLGDSSFQIAVWVVLGGDPINDNDSLDIPVYSRYTPPAPSTIDDVVSFGQSASLIAQSALPHSWFAHPIGGNILHNGDTFNTPILYDTSVFYAAAKAPGPDIKITEVVFAWNYSGATSPYPSHIPNNDFDGIEITNLGSGKAHLGGYVMEMVGYINLSYQIPANVVLDPGEVLILIHYSSPAFFDDPANNVYVMSNNHWMGAYNATGYILRDAQGEIVDVLASYYYGFDEQQTGVSPSDWTGSLAGGYAGLSRAISDYNTATDWYLPNNNNRQSFGLLNPQLSLVDGNGCYSDRTPATAFVINIPPLGEPSLSPDTLYASIQSCSDSLVLQVNLENVGDSILDYNTIAAQQAGFEGTSWQTWNTSTAATVHTFTGLPNNADTLWISLSYKGDFSSSSEYASLYIEGQLIGQIQDGDLADNTLITANFFFTGTDVANWLADGNLTVTVQNSSSVGWGYTGEFHQVDVLLKGPAPWLAVENVNASLGIGNITQINVSFHAAGLINGTYHTSFPIHFNNPGIPKLVTHCVLTVNGEAEITFTESCLHYGDQMAFTSNTDSLYLINSGCDTLYIDSLVAGLPEYGITVYGGLQIFPGDSLPVYVTFSPLTNGTYNTNLTVYSNLPDATVCLTGSAYLPPEVSLSPDTLFAVLAGCEDSLMMSFTIENLGDTTLDYQVLGGGGQAMNPICTPPTTQYCCGMGIYQFTFLNIDHLSGDGSEGYQDYSATQRAEVEAGQSYPVYVRTGTSYNEHVRIWVDFNNNGNFESNELQMATVSQFVNHSGTISIPFNAVSNVPLRVRVMSDYSGSPLPEPCSNLQYGQCEDYALIIKSGIDFASDSGSIAPGSSVSIDVWFHASGLPSGIYEGNVWVSSNDPLQSLSNVATHLEIIGNPDIAISKDSLLFDSLMIGAMQQMSFIVSNPGCSTLVVHDLSSSSQHFTVQPDSLSLLPGDSANVVVRFSPQSTGELTGLVNIQNNAQARAVFLRGVGLPAPDISVSPDTLFVNITNCNDSATTQLLVNNTGTADLFFEVTSSTGAVKLDTVLQRFSSQHSQISSLIPNRFLFSDGFTGNNISDGGLDMYDGGNYISTNYLSNIYYSDNTILPSPAFGQNGKYFTKKVDGLWLMAADLDSVSYIEITGNLGADGSGAADGSILETTFNSITYTVFIKRVYNAGDPSVNQVFITEKKSGHNQTFATYTNDGQHKVFDLTQNNRIYYLLYAGASGYYINDSITLEIAREFLRVINPAPAWLSLSPAADTIAPSGSQTITAIIHSGGLNNGTYLATIEFTSNDPDEGKYQVPVVLNVNGSAQIAYAPSSLNFGNTMQGTSASLPVWIWNTGCGDLTADSVWTTLVSDFLAGQGQFSIPPGDSLELMVDFTPTVNGPLSAQLNIQTNLGLYTINLSGVGVPAPIISTNPTALHVTIPSCNDSVSQPLWVYNTGMGDLVYQILGGNTVFYDETSQIGFNVNSAYTQHSFSGIPPNTDSLYITITLNGDFDGGSESASLFIDGQNLGVIPDGNLTNNTDILVEYAFDAAQFSGWISDGNILVGIQNTSAVDPFSGLGNFHRVNVRILSAPWLSIQGAIDTIVNGDSAMSMIQFNASGLISKDYYSQLQIISNDPYTPSLIVPCTLTVAGPAGFASSDSCAYFSTVLVGNQKEDTLYLSNTGCDTLHITTYQTSHPDFTASGIPPFIYPGGSVEIILAFQPLSVGAYNGYLELQTSIGTFQICLEGNGAAPPVLEYSPGSLTANLTDCSDTLALPLYISNSGVEDLIFDISGDATDSVQILAYTYATTTLTSNVVSALSQHFTDYSLSYSNTTSANTLAAELQGKDVLIFARFSSNAQNVFAGFSTVLQNFVDQGGTVIFTGIYDGSYSQNMYATGLLSGSYATYYTSGNLTLNTNDPFTENLSSLIPMNSYVFMHSLTNPDLIRLGTYGNSDVIAYRNVGNGRVCYMGYDFYTYQQDAALILSRFVQAATRGGIPSWLRINPMTDTVSTGDTTTLMVTFDATGLQNDTYTTYLIINTNVPGNPQDSVLCTLNLNGSAIAVIPDTCVDIGAVMIGSSLSGSFNVLNAGCDMLEINSIQNSDPELSASLSGSTLSPGQQSTVNLLFQPLTTGMHIDTIVLSSNIGTLNICIQAEALSAPELGINPASLSVAIIGCNDSITETVTISNNGNASLNWTIPAQQTEDYALYFDGYDDYVNLGSWSAGGVWTLESWVKPASLMSGRRTILGGVHNCADWAITVQDGEFAMMFKPQSALCSYTAKSGIIAEAGYWYHLALVNNGTQARLYVNGELRATHNVSPYYIGNSSGVRIGGEYCCWANNFHGYIDEVRVWNSARSITQITSKMYSGLAGNESGLLGYWPLDEGSGNLSYDQSSSGYDGNIYGPVWTLSDKPFNWVVSSPASGIVPALDSSTIHLTFYSAGLSTGTHYNTVIIETDDPLHPLVSIPCTLDITGEAEIAYSAQCLNFPATMQFAQSLRTLTISNPGCDVLEINAISSSSGSFIPQAGSININPGFSYDLDVIFQPATTGNHTESLYISSNIGNDTLCLTGLATNRPVALLSSDSLYGSPACTFTDTASIAIQNQGDVALTLSYALSSTVSWGGFIQQPNMVGPQSQETLSFWFDKSGIAPGTYTSQLSIQTNDPLNPLLLVDIVMHIPNILAYVDLGPDTGSCTGLSLQLNAGSGFASYVWSTGATTQTLSVSANGTYEVTVTDPFGCVSTDDIYVGFYDYPVALAGNDTSICALYPVSLEGSATGLIPATPVDIVIGSGTQVTSSTLAVPFKTYYMDGKTQLLYTRSELKAMGFEAGPIYQIGFQVVSPGSPAMQGLSIHMGETGNSSLNGFVAGLEAVYDTNIYQPVSGWNMFHLQQPFYWTGEDHLIVELCFNNNSWSSNSSMVYTEVNASVWANYCDNCAPGCSLTGGSGTSMRANLRILGQSDRSRYTWTGPNAYQAGYRFLNLPALEASMAGIYTLMVDNGWGCTDSDQLNLGILPSPVVDAGMNDTILLLDTAQLSGNVSGGVAPYTYSWSPSSLVEDPDSLHTAAYPLMSNWFTLEASGQNGCMSSDQVWINVIPVHLLSGQVRYVNQQLTGMSDVLVTAYSPVLGTIDSTRSGQGGLYELRLQEGSYLLEAYTDAPWYGANATDALVIARHATFYTNLTGPRLDAADVNLSSSVNATDALLVMRRFVGRVDTFAAGDWVIQSFVQQSFTSDKVLNIDLINTGDVDASNVPNKAAPDFVRMSYASTPQRSQGKEASIPVFLKESAEVGAISLELLLPEGVSAVSSISTDLENLVYQMHGQKLRIAWQDPLGSFIPESKPLFILHCTLRSDILQAQYLSLGSGNEFADPEGVVMKNVELITQGFGLQGDGPSLGRNYPDPFSVSTQIPYYLPEDARIQLSLHDVLGRHMTTLYEGHMQAGNHLYTLDGSRLSPGVYFYQLRIEGEMPYTASFKMIISR